MRVIGASWRLDWIEQCFTSPPTQYRFYGRRELGTALRCSNPLILDRIGLQANVCASSVVNRWRMCRMAYVHDNCTISLTRVCQRPDTTPMTSATDTVDTTDTYHRAKQMGSPAYTICRPCTLCPLLPRNCGCCVALNRALLFSQTPFSFFSLWRFHTRGAMDTKKGHLPNSTHTLYSAIVKV